MVRISILTSLFLLCVSSAEAAQLRYRYVPIDAAGNTTLQPSAAAPGEERTWLGGARQPAFRQPRPNTLLTFRHTITGQPITIPLTLPEDVPTIQYAGNRVVYGYTGYTIQVVFLPDGSAEVIYNSGLRRI